MKKKILIIGIGTALTGVLAYMYFKYKSDAKLDTSITNGDKITANSLSDAQNKTSKATTPVSLEEARSISVKIADNNAKIRKYKKKSSKQAVEKDNANLTQKLFEMGYIALPDGNVQKI